MLKIAPDYFQIFSNQSGTVLEIAEKHIHKSQFIYGDYFMKKLLKDIIIAIIALAIICAVFWKINWISNWKEVAFLYFLLALAIIFDCIKKMFMK